MTKPNKTPLTSFGPELQNALRVGATKRLTIRFDTRNIAIRFTQRINALRKAMRDEQYKGWEELYRTEIRIDPVDPIVTLEPKDSAFRPFLIGLVPDIPPPPETTIIDMRKSATPNPSDPAPDASTSSFLDSIDKLGYVEKSSEPAPTSDKSVESSEKQVDRGD